MENAGAADLLVINGAEPWPAHCVARLPDLPVVASLMAYLPAIPAAQASEIRPRSRVVTAPSERQAQGFLQYLGIDDPRTKPVIVGSPQADALPERRGDGDFVLVLTSVTHADKTGNGSHPSGLLARVAEN